MAINLSNVSEKFDKARVLLEERSKTDPRTDPYKSKYAAKNIFLSLKSDLKKLQDIHTYENDSKRLKCLLAAVDYYIGIISIETEELSTGEEHLNSCLNILKDIELEPECIMTMLNTYNQLGILWSQRNEPEKSRCFLEKAECLYNQYMLICGKPPYDIPDIFNGQTNDYDFEKNNQKFESILTHTLYYLAQVYTTLDMNDRAAQYCHSTLKRQLESKEFNPIEWATNCCNLSQYFLSKENFKSARHHLACAVDIMNQHESELMSKEMNEEDESRWEAFRSARADIALQWVNYGQSLLSASKDMLMEKANEDLPEDAQNDDDEPDDVTRVIETLFPPPEPPTQPDMEQNEFSVEHNAIFQSLEVTSIEEQIPIEHVMTFSEAREVFLNAQKWLQIAKEYYTLDDHATHHVQIVQALSTLYKLLIFFESHADRQCKMHKRRVDMLEQVLNELNPRYYLDVCRQLEFELGEIFSDMTEIKLAMLRDGEADSTTHALLKINHLAKQSISYFTMFLDSFKDGTQKRVTTFSDEVVRPNLLAYFHIGSLYSKITAVEQEKKLEYLKKSMEHFQYFVEYCDDHQEVIPLMKQELDVSQEMVKLFPIKAERIFGVSFR